MKDSLKQAIILQAVEESVTYTDSKLGGRPYCKLGDDFPVHSSGIPYMFIAQLNFAKLPKLEDYPQQGLLQFLCWRMKSMVFTRMATIVGIIRTLIPPMISSHFQMKKWSMSYVNPLFLGVLMH
ncbi:DUF1963 domain-containing protein [Lysinibacillus sp. FSL K6-3209]|uniref:DUF1963 domain-containing protein n=1 Tax=Lysinibacillus sp. FSL K6-3209 TaxID=2921497 RepID=UPI0030D9D8B9